MTSRGEGRRDERGSVALRAVLLAFLGALALAATGCQWSRTRGHWDDAQFPSRDAAALLLARERQTAGGDCGAEALLAATECELSSSAAAHYYRAAIASARCLDASDIDEAAQAVAWQTYQASLKGLLVALTAPSHPAPRGPLVVTVDGQAVQLAVAMHGFAWDADDFQRLTVVESYRSESLSRVHRRSGVGVPVVIQRRQRTGGIGERFLPPRSAFAATAVLRPTTLDGDGAPSTSAATLELHNPYAVASVDFGERRLPLAADLSAALAYYAIHESPAVNPIAAFLNPGASTGDEGLYFLEPHQPGKIPIVFVHGLVSSPSTWTDMVNDLRATPGFSEHYQVWAFRYATGSSFLRAAAHLRRSLYEAAATVDPAGEDPALASMVLVGHSMGGLVSKLQAVDSRDALWRSVAARPLETIRADAATRQELAEVLFFARNPHVRRVVFIAVPHGGSSWATRPVGRVASALVRGDDTRDAMHARLIADNPDVFAPQVRRRLPTSIDMLEPTNPLLLAIRDLPVCPAVRVHSVIGTGGAFSAIEPSDGVVPAASAVHAIADTTTYIPARHERVHRETETVRRLQAILAVHLAEYAAEIAQVKRASAVGAAR